MLVKTNILDLKEGDVFYLSHHIAIKFVVKKYIGLVNIDNVYYVSLLIKSAFQEYVDNFELTDSVIKVIPNN